MIEYRRKEKLEGKKERKKDGKRKERDKTVNTEKHTCKAGCNCLYFYHTTAFILSSPH